ncbi:class I SAM-dependent rRNA methyltransferase, partial [Listeria monocytogenes]|nr:class I SAM-dependent rRNA methyltransferase [Listeria monocytogenes]
MEQMNMKIKLTKQESAKLRKKNPLIQREDLQQAIETKEWVTFTDQANQFLGIGYLGEQNKGIGWVVSFEETVIDQAFFAQRFAKAKGKRSAYYQDELTDAFRLFNGEGDQLGGLTVDLYGEYVVFSWYNATLYQHKKAIVAAFRQIFPEIKGAYEKIRFASELPESAWVYGETAPEPLLVKENGVTYATYLNEGLMTGIFLDQKEVRGQLVDGLAAGKS